MRLMRPTGEYNLGRDIRHTHRIALSPPCRSLSAADAERIVVSEGRGNSFWACANVLGRLSRTWAESSDFLGMHGLPPFKPCDPLKILGPHRI
jgi:hypothetical protein